MVMAGTLKLGHAHRNICTLAPATSPSAPSCTMDIEKSDTSSRLGEAPDVADVSATDSFGESLNKTKGVGPRAELHAWMTVAGA